MEDSPEYSCPLCHNQYRDSDMKQLPKVSQIFSSTSEIINAQSVKIYELTEEIKSLKSQNQLFKKKLEIQKQCHNQHSKLDVQQLVNKVLSLQQEMTRVKLELAEYKSATLNHQFNIMKQKKKQMNINHQITISSAKNKLNPVQNYDPLKLKQQIISECMALKSTHLSNDCFVLVSTWLKNTENYLKYPYLIACNKQISFKFKQKCYELSKRGIPDTLRQSIWPLIFQNSLNLTTSLYADLLEHKKHLSIYKKVDNQIDKDIDRSFYSRPEFQDKIGLRDEVKEILQIFHIYRPDVSYVQGMTYPVIVLDLLVGKYRAFVIFANLIVGNIFFRRLFTFEKNYFSIYCRTFENLMKETMPNIDFCLRQKNIEAEVYLIGWLFTMFSRDFSYETTLLIWDCLAYEGELLLIKIALSILNELEQSLSQCGYQQTIQIILQFQSHIRCPQRKLVEKAISMKLTCQKFTKAFEMAYKQQKISQQNIKKD